ncbi:MAG: L,D-transpeptidase [Symploca sp. SIO1C4]|uniref:L,D-transpeptidase n=1 Tax=Symploca sp. SIO1C4 TaxID=2607765 RepID=A0A6B3NE03_9CYAN|nr:L,D-transpeptidase [Symploca sp. SIO1C4]
MWIYVNVQFLVSSSCLLVAAILTLQRSLSSGEWGVQCQCQEEVAVSEVVERVPDAGIARAGEPASSSPSVQPSLVLQVSLIKKRVAVIQNGSTIAEYPIATGKPGWETPMGTYPVIDMRKNPTWQHPITGEIVPPGERNPMGTRWLAFVEVGGGSGVIGFHGTNNPSSIGTASSHGCLRMLNQDIEALYRLVESVQGQTLVRVF